MPAAPPDSDPYIGQTLPGGLVVKRLIGTGAFARVYEGRTTKNESAAIKILQEKSPEALQLFTREIKIMRALPAHRHRVRSLGDGHTPMHQPFLAMEFVDGGTLKDTIRQRGALPIPEACELMLQLCDAFSDLHALGVVHRDLKPENVLVSKNNQIKLSDFGLVKDAQGLLQAFEKEDILKGRVFHNRFDQRLVMGTPEYMAPEQFSDPLLDDQEQAKTDTWTDVYALGLVFYQMLAGHKLWQMKGSSASSVDAQRTLTQFIAVRVDPSSVSEIRSPPGVPAQLFAIIERSLRHDPKLRHHTASQLAEDIRTYVTTGNARDDFDDTATNAVNLKDMARHLPAGMIPTPVSRPRQPAAAATSVRTGPVSSQQPQVSSGKSGAMPPPQMSSGKSGAMPAGMMSSGKSGAMPPPQMTSGKSGAVPPRAPVKAPQPDGLDDAAARQADAADVQPDATSDGEGFDDASTHAVDMKEVMREVRAARPPPSAQTGPARANVIVESAPAMRPVTQSRQSPVLAPAPAAPPVAALDPTTSKVPAKPAANKMLVPVVAGAVLFALAVVAFVALH